MALKTQAVRDLVIKALKDIAQPYSEDVICDVAKWIESNARLEYDLARKALKKDVAENWIGQWTLRSLPGWHSIGKISVDNSTIIDKPTIIKSYSKLAKR
ncbi:MAG: hypothetical protein ABFD49_11505 [Armatimonadota bacterium]|nr:hypothetical protein [bacterium]